MADNELRIKSYVRYKGDALDANEWSFGGPMARRTAPDGRNVLENVPTSASCRMVNNSGDVVNVPLFPGAGRPSLNDPSHLQWKGRILARGFIPYGTCPKHFGLHSTLPEIARSGAPCEKDPDGHVIDDDHPCACTIATRDERKNKANTLCAINARRYETESQEDRRRRERQADDIAAIAKAAMANTKGKR